jgi:hypothetical protein
MPYNEVFDKWKAGTLHSGSKSGPVVKGQKQAIAIYLSEKKKARQGKSEYKATGRKVKKLPLKSLMSRGSY